MEIEIPNFRELYEALWSPEETWYSEALPGWMSQARDVLTALEPFRRRNTAANPYPITTTDEKEIQRRRKNPEQIDPTSWDLCRWYALSRISDKLLTLFPHDHAPVLNRQRQEQGQYYSDYFASLGFTVYWDRPFHPFYHEIVAVHTDSSLAPGEVVVDYTYWPGLMFGEMLFARSGVRVLCAPGTLNRQVAESSVLYFTYRREGRKTCDLSMGWGGNSQWCTDFRRDYAEADAYHFNVDASYPLDEGYESYLPDSERRHLDDLTLEERKELLIHRCFVTCAKDNVPGAMERTPWSERLSLPIAAVWYFQNGDPNTADDSPAGGRE